MTPLYCSQNHENPSGSRFCHLCGEPLQASVSGGMNQGLILGDRYRVIRELGHGGFGRTYLAEDLNRFNEPCVLKEFAPQVSGSHALQKAEELFAREAGVLYKLQHPQIPRFRELFRVQLADKGRLFLVQDYVEGQTYHALLEARKRQGQHFSEAEVTQLLVQILPVLQYIHSLGVVHRDISPDNLMLRSADWLPVLIDFGGVKQVAATVESQFNLQSSAAPSAATRLGKVGYAPDEQMQMGIVSPPSDLYALGVTALVLLTGKTPYELLDHGTPLGQWYREVNLSPKLEAVLNRLLAQPRDRYPSARDVLQDLTSPNPTAPHGLTQPPPSQAQPQSTTNAATYVASQPPVSSPIQVERNTLGPVKVLVVLLLMATTGVGSWWTVNRWLSSRPIAPSPSGQPVLPSDNPNSPAVSPFSQEEQQRKDALGKRRASLGIDYQFFIKLVDQQFNLEHPELNQRPLSTGPEDAALRTKWDETADRLLDQLESLSPGARSQLGDYSKADRDRWIAEVNKLRLSGRAFYDLVDAKFFQVFSNQPNTNFINQPIGQVWQAIAADQLQLVQNGTALETIRFKPGSYDHELNDTLKPGEGKAYIISLSKDQFVRLSLQSNQSTFFSFYPPTNALPAFLEDSKESNWSGKLPQSGFYEIVVVAKAAEPVTYTLTIAADNVSTSTPSPVPPLSPEPVPPSPSAPLESN